MSSGSLRRISYLSRFAESTTLTDVDAILTVSQRRNQEVDVTGILMVSNNSFFQILEGESDAVEETWNRIRGDRRHRDVILLSDTERTQRYFDHWAMQKLLSTHGDEQLDGVGRAMDSALRSCLRENVHMSAESSTDSQSRVFKSRVQDVDSLLTGIAVLAYHSSKT